MATGASLFVGGGIFLGTLRKGVPKKNAGPKGGGRIFSGVQEGARVFFTAPSLFVREGGLTMQGAGFLRGRQRGARLFLETGGGARFFGYGKKGTEKTCRLRNK